MVASAPLRFLLSDDSSLGQVDIKLANVGCAESLGNADLSPTTSLGADVESEAGSTHLSVQGRASRGSRIHEGRMNPVRLAAPLLELA